MSLTDVNWLAIVVSAVIVFGLGALWYGPLFGKKWSAAMGWENLSEDEIKAMQSEAMPAYVTSVVGALITAYVLSVLMTGVDDRTLINGLGLGALVWFGFMALPSLVNAMFMDTNKTVFWINAAYQFVYMMIIGALIAVWV